MALLSHYVKYTLPGLPMKPKYDLLKAIGPVIRELMPPSPPPTDLQVLLLRLAMQAAERAHYRCVGWHATAPLKSIGR